MVGGVFLPIGFSGGRILSEVSVILPPTERQNPNSLSSFATLSLFTFPNPRRQKNVSRVFKTQQKSTEAGKEKGQKSGMIAFYIL
jgi:hypothetical protein